MSGNPFKLSTPQTNETSENNVYKLFNPVAKNSVVRKRFLISSFNIWISFFVNLLCFQTYKSSFFRFCWSNSTKNCVDICCSGMENLLEINKEPPSCSQDFDIDLNRLEFFNMKLKTLDFTNIFFVGYHKLSFDDRPSILKNFYLKTSKQISGWFRYIFVSLAFFGLFLLGFLAIILFWNFIIS